MFCLRFVVLVTWSLAFTSEGSLVPPTCDSPQYLELRRPGTILCTFHEGFFSVFWYNTSEYVNNDPIIQYSNLLKSGYGYESGEFDVCSNGSLIVKNVSMKHERIYTAAYLYNRAQDPIIFEIPVNVIVKPDISFPHILNCGSNRTACYYKGKSPVRCSIKDVRPNITLTWMARTLHEDKVILIDAVATRGTIGYTFLVTTTDFFHYSPFLALLVCKASSRLNLLQKNDSMILVENPSLNLSSTNRTPRYVERGSVLELTCTYDAIAFVVWKKAITPDGSEYKDLLYSVFVGEKFGEVYADNINVDEKGTLIVLQVDVLHEGIYFSEFGNGVTNGWIMYDVTVIVNPSPGYPVIDGCNHQHYCVLEVKRNGTLTCKVKGIRPQIQLQWEAFYDSDADLISFTNQKLVVKDNGETFDVSLTATYYVIDTSRDRLTIECKEPKQGNMFKLKTTLDLFFTANEPTRPVTVPSSSRQILWIISIGVFLVIIISAMFGGIILKKYCGHRRDNVTQHEDTAEVWEQLQMLSSQLVKREESELLELNTRNLNESGTEQKRKHLINQLREKYKDLYDAVQPIPYIRDRLYCVDRIFVEGGIQLLERSMGKDDSWESLLSYADIFNDPRIDFNRLILEGDPGYGKSTVTLQIAYDWCNHKATSKLKDAEILVLLRLRQLGGVPSLFKAIKYFLLPRDSQLNEKDIQEILTSGVSVIIILDGYDEYPDQDKASDFMEIFQRNMCQDFQVILTTRSAYLPNSFAPQTKRVRLTGFEEKAQEMYIRKAVVGDDNEAVENIKYRIQENPVLSGLCEVPLFFVMFAHMIHESANVLNFNSVTSFFRHMIACFHEHMKNKMAEKNVTSYKFYQNDHQKLDKIALDGLRGDEQHIVWMKEDLRKQIGKKFYEAYIRVGILVEEDVLRFVDKPEIEPIVRKTEVRFYHKLFCEWYAAHYLAKYASQIVSFSLGNIVKQMDPFDLQYMYRFACGLNPRAADKIIKRLCEIEGGEKFAVLCIMEKSGKTETIKETLRELCSEGVVISGHDSKLLQRSYMQLLEIAAMNDVSCLFKPIKVDLECKIIRTYILEVVKLVPFMSHFHSLIRCS